MKNVLRIAMFASMCMSSLSAEAQLKDRCRLDDQLTTTELAHGRNAWARRCGFISTKKETFLNEEGEYQIFAGACHTYPNVPIDPATGKVSDCKRYVPASEFEACIPTTELLLLGTCPTGCVTPSQKVSFGGKHMPVPEALASGERTITALTPTATLLAPTFSEQAIRTYVSGDTVEDVFSLSLENGLALEVTSEHPMVDGEGNIVKAKTLKPGDVLLASDGRKVSISSINVFRFKGYVWNIQPVSHDKAENIFDLEGMLTGSLRFQNEWASLNYRLAFREEADVQGL
ncbi:Hint domain-containing protein [Cystobacter fuscus]|uniref:Hint domain-containing protein n=1 Tax=Cystobacter fuscus TaxID=43 RepID=UPI0037BE7D14